MNILKISNVFFSPTDSSRLLAETVANEFPQKSIEIDITPFSARKTSINFSKDELVIFSVPVYGGRIPTPAAETLKQMHGHRTPVILLAVYGNRDYDDALLELYDLASEQGFVPIAAAALIAEHNIMHSVGAGRPDHSDIAQIKNFAAKVFEKITAVPNDQELYANLDIKGNRPYKTFGGFPMKPITNSDCTKCGLCASLCPVHAIPENAPNTTINETCISCMRCIKICPNQARSLDKQLLAEKEKGFYARCSVRKEPEFII